MLLYTDGITEVARRERRSSSLRSDSRRAFGDGGDGPAEVIDRLRAAVRAHQQGQPALDDQTLVFARAL